MKIGRQEVEGREAERKEEKSSFLRKQFSILSPYILRPEGLKSLSRNPQALRSEMRNRSDSHSWTLRMLQSNN